MGAMSYKSLLGQDGAGTILLPPGFSLIRSLCLLFLSGRGIVLSQYWEA